MQGELVARHLLGRHHERIQVGRHAAIHQQQVSHVFQTRREPLRRDAASAALQLGAVRVAGGEQELFHAVDRQVLVAFERGAGIFVQPGDERQLAQDKQQRLRFDGVRADRLDVVRRGEHLRRFVIRLANPRPVQ